MDCLEVVSKQLHGLLANHEFLGNHSFQLEQFFFFFLLVSLYCFPFSWSIMKISCYYIVSLFLSLGKVGRRKQFNNSASWRYVIVIKRGPTLEADLA